MSVLSAREILYPGKSLLNCNIAKGMNLEQVTAVLAGAIELIYNNQSLEGLDFTKYGITCSQEEKPALLQVVESLLKTQVELGKRLNVVNAYFDDVKESTSAISDEKVKLAADSAQTKYLGDWIDGTPGRIKQTADKLTITGLAPIGGRMFISPKRINDFDGTGKGKAGTDLEGWAIRNGQNGLDNALGRLVKYTDILANAGKKEGSNSFLVKMVNIEAFELPVTGSISDGLTEDITIKIPVNTRWSGHATSGTYSNKVQLENNNPNMIFSAPTSFKHTHSHTLKVSNVNPQPQQITLDLEHVKEIPIEFIGI